MESVLALSPLQQFLIVAMHAWMFFIFPIWVIRKLNNITNLLEVQVYEEEDEGDAAGSEE